MFLNHLYFVGLAGDSPRTLGLERNILHPQVISTLRDMESMDTIRWLLRNYLIEEDPIVEVISVTSRGRCSRN